MAKRRSRKSASKLTLNSMADEGKKVALFMGGALIGTQLIKALDKNRGGMAGVMGLDGESSKILAPSIAAAIGLAVGATAKDTMVRSIGHGIASVGGAVMLQEVSGLQMLPTAPSKPPVKTPKLLGLGYEMDELPEPTVSGLGEATYVDDDGNIYDEHHNMINGLEHLR